jgi:predicted DNA-binding transcriptional regulator YafY
VGTPASPAVMSGYQSPDVTRLSMVSDAFFNQRCARITYRDGSGSVTIRDIEPHFLFLSLPVWYLLAFDKLRQDIRQFRVDRINNCDLLDLHFRLAKPEPYLASAEAGLEGI